MKELRRKVTPDNYKYKGKKVKSFRVIFDYLDDKGEIESLRLRFKKRADAEQELTRLIEQHTESNGAFVPDKKQLTLKEYAERHYKPAMLKRLSPTSHANEISRVDEAVKILGHHRLANITRLHIKAYKEHLQNKTARNAKKVNGESPKFSIASVNKYLTRFRAMLNEARMDIRGLPEFNFTGDIIQKKMEKKRSKTINFFEFDRLLEACVGKQKYLGLYLIALWETGARVSEVIGNGKRLAYLPGLRRKDIDFENQRIELWNSKLHPGLPPKARRVYLSEFFRDALIAYGVKNLEPDELVFRRGDFRDDWEIVKKRAGIDESDDVFWIKDFRHCFINNCDSAGVPRAAIKHQINHAGDDLLEAVYINLDESKLTELFIRYEQYCRERRAAVETEKSKQKALKATA